MRATRGTVLSSGTQEPGTERTNPFSTSTRPGRPTPIPDTPSRRSSAEARARSISVRSVSTTLPSPWVGSWVVARTLPSGHTSPADIMEAPTSTPIIGAGGIVIRAEAGKRCAIAEVEPGWSPSAGGMQDDLADLVLGARQEHAADDDRGSKLTWRTAPGHVQGRHARWDVVMLSLRPPAVSACEFMVQAATTACGANVPKSSGSPSTAFLPRKLSLLRPVANPPKFHERSAGTPLARRSARSAAQHREQEE